MFQVFFGVNVIPHKDKNRLPMKMFFTKLKRSSCSIGFFDILFYVDNFFAGMCGSYDFFNHITSVSNNKNHSSY